MVNGGTRGHGGDAEGGWRGCAPFRECLLLDLDPLLLKRRHGGQCTSGRGGDRAGEGAHAVEIAAGWGVWVCGGESGSLAAVLRCCSAGCVVPAKTIEGVAAPGPRASDRAGGPQATRLAGVGAVVTLPLANVCPPPSNRLASHSARIPRLARSQPVTHPVTCSHHCSRRRRRHHHLALALAHAHAHARRRCSGVRGAAAA